MPTTPKGAPYPAPTAPNNVPADLQALATWSDERPGIAPMSAASRAALAGAQRWEGRVVFETDTDRLVIWDGTTWRMVPAETTADGAWQTWTPTATGASIDSATGRWRIMGKTCQARGRLVGVSSLPGASGVGASLPAPAAASWSSFILGTAWMRLMSGSGTGSSAVVLRDGAGVLFDFGTASPEEPSGVNITFTAEYEIA